MAEKPNESNETLDNVELVKVGEYEVSMKTLEDGKVEIESPKGLEDDKDFQAEATKVVSAMALANKKGFDTNKQQKELDEKRAKFEQEKSEWALKATQNESYDKIPTKKSLIMKELNIKNNDDFEDVSRADYLDAEEKADKIISDMRDKVSDNKMLVADFITKGGDYNGLLTFANSLGVTTITKALINQFTKTNETKPEFTSKSLADIQKTQISFVKTGGASPNARSNKADNILKAGNSGTRL